jgi:transposase-like protein
MFRQFRKPRDHEGDGMTVRLLEGRWYTTEELAQMLGVDPSTVRRWRTARPAQGPAFVQLSSRVTVYSAYDVERWLLNRRTDPEETKAA